MSERLIKIVIYIVVAVLIITTLFYIKAWGTRYYEDNKIHKQYDSKIKQLLPKALINLQENKDDWLYCTGLGLSIEDINQPQVMAAWVTYFQYGEQYCNRWWTWKANPCDELAKEEKNSDDNGIIRTKIILCHIAETNKKNSRNTANNN